MYCVCQSSGAGGDMGIFAVLPSGDAGQVPPAPQEILLLKESEISDKSTSYFIAHFLTHSSKKDEVRPSCNKWIKI